MKAIGARLKSARGRRELTIRDLASESGVGEATIRRIEHGKADPNTTTVRKLAMALGASPAWLRYGDEIGNRPKWDEPLDRRVVAGGDRGEDVATQPRPLEPAE